ncbi:MAG: hypothetical protein ACW9XA_08040 [Candidatus Nitrosopumilus sp. bin_6a]
MFSEETFSRLYDFIINGNFEKSFEIFTDYAIVSENHDFEDVLDRIIININENYQNEKINDATLHVSQIICQTLKKMISENQTFL